MRVVGAAGDSDLLAASRCHGWTVLDVVVHVRVGLQEMLGGVVAGAISRLVLEGRPAQATPLAGARPLTSQR